MLRKTTSHYPVARRDPIFTPIFTSFFATLGFSASTAAFLGAATTAIATTALSIGIQALMAPKPPKPEDGKVPKVQSMPYRQWCVGTNRLAGAYMLWEAKGNELFAVQAIAGHRLFRVNRYWLHDDEVEIGSNGETVEGDRYGDNVWIAHRLGLPVETAYDRVVARLAGEGIWTNNHRGDGQASIAMIAKGVAAKNQNERFPYGAPSLSVEADCAYVFDYRISADPNNSSAWVFSKNSALIMCWHQCFNEFGHRRDFSRAILPVLDMWIEEANICEEDVALHGGGTENRYECNGFDTTENDPKAGTNAILATCDGWICERGDGALLFTVGKFRETRVETLSDADLVGHQVQYDVLFEDEINRLIPKFTYPAVNYATSDTDFFEDTAAQLESGRVLARDADYRWVHQWRQARRLGKRDWLRIQEKVSGSLDVRLSGINAIYSRWVRLETPITLPRLNGKLVENRKSTLALLNGGFNMEIMQHPENIDVWTPSIDEGAQPPVPPRPNAEDLVTPVINLIQSVANGGAVYIRVVVIDPADSSLTAVVRYRVSNNGSGNPGAWVEQLFPDAAPSGGFLDLNTQTVPADQLLDVQVAFQGTNGKYSDWSTMEQVTSTADPTPPAAVTGVSVTSGEGQATFSWTGGNSANYAGAKIYYNTVNDFGTASYAAPVEFGGAATADAAARDLDAADYFGWVVSVNRSGVEGAPVATGSFVVS
jgi:hypothetical protein